MQKVKKNSDGQYLCLQSPSPIQDDYEWSFDISDHSENRYILLLYC